MSSLGGRGVSWQSVVQQLPAYYDPFAPTRSSASTSFLDPHAKGTGGGGGGKVGAPKKAVKPKTEGKREA